MSLNEHQANNEIWAQVGSIFYFGYAITITLILVIHSFKTFQDLCTEERKSVSQRRKKPTLTPAHKFINVATCISILCAAISIISSTISWFITNDLYCDIQKTFVLTGIQAQKTWMYLVFLIRLYTVYAQSAFSYSKKSITIWCIIVVSYGIITLTTIAILTTSQVYKYGDDAYPNWCGPGEGLFFIAGGLIYMQDLGVTIGFLCAFLIPLKKLFKMAGPQKATINKIVYAATKTTILTGTSTISSLIFPSMTAGTGVGLFSGIDLIVNPLCMILMTPYYKDDLLYRPLFCICIKLCDRSGKTGKDASDDNDNNKNDKKSDLEPTMTVTTEQSAKSAESKTNTTTLTTTSTATLSPSINASSVDTMSQIRVTGATTNPQNYQEIDKGISPEPPITDIDIDTDNEQP